MTTPSAPEQGNDNPAGPGHQILLAAVDEAAGALGTRLTAAFAIGSLAHGGFAPLVSDVDLALIVDRVDGSTAATIDGVAERSVRRFAGTEHESLAGRLSIFWSDWDHIGRNEEFGRFPAIDRLDLLDSGVLLRGVDRRPECAKPTRDDLFLNSAAFALASFGDDGFQRKLHDPNELARQGARAVTKAVLFPVRFLYTAATGRLGRNDDAIAWYAEAERPRTSHDLVIQAARWRADGIDDTAAAAALLDHGLVPLYLDCADQLSRSARELGRVDLADRLASLRAALGAGGAEGAGAPAG
jgi:hypothetical protein